MTFGDFRTDRRAFAPPRADFSGAFSPLRLCAVFFLLVVLSACGFHLRGHASLPPEMDRVHLVLPDPNGNLGRALRPLLRANGATLVDQPSPNAAVLTILEDNLQREILTVSRQARVSEYLLRYRVRFRVTGANGDTLVPERSLEVSQDYTFNEGVVLGKQREENILREELYQEMARLMLLRIAAATTEDAKTVRK